MSARLKRQAVLVLTWLLVTTSATAMAWWSVTFVTAVVADRRPLRPSDVVAASVRQNVPTPAWVFGAVAMGPPSAPPRSPGMPEVAIAAVVVPVQVKAPTPVAPSPVQPATTTTRLVARRSSGPTVVHAAVVIQGTSLPVVARPPLPVPGPQSSESEEADLPVASASGLVHGVESPTLVDTDPPRTPSSSSSQSHRWRTAEGAVVTPATVDPEWNASATTTPWRSRRHGHRPTPFTHPLTASSDS